MAMESPQVKAYIVQQLDLPETRNLAAAVRKIMTFCIGNQTPLAKSLFFRT